MATKIKLMRLGKMRHPQYRVVVADARTKRDGRSIETIGKYHPKEDPSFIEIDSERAQYWLSVGAQPTEPVLALLKVTGDWQKFKGLPAPEPMRTAAPRADKRAIFEAAAKEAAAIPTAEATTPRKKSGKKAAKSAGEGKSPDDKSAGGKSAEGKTAQTEAPAAKAQSSDEPANETAEK